MGELSLPGKMRGILHLLRISQNSSHVIPLGENEISRRRDESEICDSILLIRSVAEIDGGRHLPHRLTQPFPKVES